MKKFYFNTVTAEITNDKKVVKEWGTGFLKSRDDGYFRIMKVVHDHSPRQFKRLMAQYTK